MLIIQKNLEMFSNSALKKAALRTSAKTRLNLTLKKRAKTKQNKN